MDEVRFTFGDEVADIVAICTEPSKRSFNWESRKLHMIEALRDAPLSAKLVAAADKYHNLAHTLYTKQALGSAIWERFGRDEAHQAWYYRSMLKSITANVLEPQRYPIFGRLELLIEEIFDGLPS
jgi:(p)ppGpp synthase/HD superfamily hydrolase